MVKRYRLLGRAHLDGAVREPGYIFTLPLDAEGNEIRGPHKTVEHSADRIDMMPGSDHSGDRIPGKLRDQPLFEEIGEDEEIAPTVERSASVRAAEMAMAGGSNVVADEQQAAAERRERREYLDSKGDDVTDEERRERDEIRAHEAEPHIGEKDPEHAGGHVHDADWQGEKPPLSEGQGHPSHHEVPVGERADTAKFDETLGHASGHRVEHDFRDDEDEGSGLPKHFGEENEPEPPHDDARQKPHHELGPNGDVKAEQHGSD